MSPNPSPRQPAVRIITSYDDDVAGAADALLATLRPAPPPDALALNSERRKDPDNTESTAEQSTAA
jgi:hypothetical protein